MASSIAEAPELSSGGGQHHPHSCRAAGSMVLTYVSPAGHRSVPGWEASSLKLPCPGWVEASAWFSSHRTITKSDLAVLRS